ncbi:hypothetical protein [Nitrosopumilus sp. b1]|uniref:hypothetical protein n=1 Tax=Nitrosopumilus sp. b1 TaxID=2109907 RepID=UPI002105EDE3|nr:hypothetical protein [Nitrosopumilus sp. b1]
MQQCSFCGSVFGDRKCYFCDARCCTSCMTDDRTRCKQCYIKKRRLGVKKLLKKNKIVLGFIGFLWFYAVYPGPFLPGLDPNFYYLTLIAAVLIMIPVGLALFFWSLHPPSSDLKKEKD